MWKVYQAGEAKVTLEQERKYNEVERKTNSAKTDALTTPNVDDELLKYARPDK